MSTAEIFSQHAVKLCADVLTSHIALDKRGCCSKHFFLFHQENNVMGTH